MERSEDYIQYFEPRLMELLDSLEKRQGKSFLSGTAKEDVIRTGEKRIRNITESYFHDLSAQVVKDDNPLAQFDLSMLTSGDKKKAAGVIIKELESGERVLPERMRKAVDVILSSFEDFLCYLLKCLSEHREAVCDLLFNGKLYTKITHLSFGEDTHNRGKCTTVVQTDAGRLVFKPHSCAIDEKAYGFIGKYFDDMIVMPKVYAVGEEFGVCEFLEKRVAEGDDEAKEYYYSLGGTAAVIKMFGSMDMHMNNLFAYGTKLALIDIETLLYPYHESTGRIGDGCYAPEDKKAIFNSLLRSAFLNTRQEGKNNEKEFSILSDTSEEGSAPVVNGQKRTVPDYLDVYLKGFSDIYERCVERKTELKRDIREYFSNHTLRVTVRPSRPYVEVLKRLNSCYSYQSEEYYQSQLDKLPKVLESDISVINNGVTLSEIRHLKEGEVPFFYTSADSRSIFADGALITADYYTQSAQERVCDILDSMGEEEKQFEIQIMRLSLSNTQVTEDKAPPERILRETVPITRENAIRASEAILERIFEAGLKLKSGERTWFYFDPGSESSSLMNMSLYTGLSGMAVYFAAIAKAAEGESTIRKAKQCLDSAMHMLERFFCNLELYGNREDKRKISLGEGSGLGGILKAFVLVNRYTEGTYDSLLVKAKSLICRIDPDMFESTDKSGGISGLIVTLCRYEELYSDENIRQMIQKLARRLIALRTLDYEDTFFWKTIKNHPISGAVHGMTGIAESLLMADLRLETTEFEKDAWDALVFEDACFDEELGYWTDRRIPGSKKRANGNCYGPEGMGIICRHLKDVGIMNSLTERISKNAEKMVYTPVIYRRDHLCCGNMSSVDYYLETADLDMAGILLAQIVKEAGENGEYRMGYAHCLSNNNVTLFYGLAGIGYELVRYTAPDRFPTVL